MTLMEWYPLQQMFLYFLMTKVNVRINVWKTGILRLNKQIAAMSALVITWSPRGSESCFYL